MARKKVQLRYTADAAARKASAKKRRQGLLKKVQELSILCDVQACAVVYAEDGIEPPVHWPEDGGEVDMVLQRFQGFPEMERRKKMVTKDEYMRQKTEKYREHAKKLQSSVHEMEMFHLMQLIHVDGRPHSEFTTSELMRLSLFMSDKVRELERKADVLAKAGNVVPPPPLPPHRSIGGVPQPNPPAAYLVPSGDFQGFLDMLRRRAPPSVSRMPEKGLLPFPRPNEGNTCRFPATARNFEVGGDSSTANVHDSDHDAQSNDPSSALRAIFPCTTGNLGGYASYPYEWNNIGVPVLNTDPVGSIGEEYVDVGPYIGQLQPGPGLHSGQYGGTSDIARGYINLPKYLEPPRGYIGSAPSFHNPKLGRNTNMLGGFGFNVEAAPENIPRASTVSIARPSHPPDIIDPNRGRNNGPPEVDHRSSTSGRGI